MHYATMFQSSIELTLSKAHFHDAIMEAKPRDRMGIGMITSDSDSELGGSPTQHQLYIQGLYTTIVLWTQGLPVS